MARDRVQYPLYGDRPGWRVGKPGSLFGNAASGTQIREACRERLGMPDPTWVRVTFRDAGDETLLVMEPVLPPADPLQREPDTYPLKWSAHRAPIVRRLKLLFEAAQFELRPDVWYQMPTEVGEDEGGAVVFGSWTNASLLPRESEGDEEAAAGEQGQG